jgi:predicted O-linked N-acetylglucosamine transferase (SPINDLY family)
VPGTAYSIPASLARAVELHRRGELAPAAAAYREILARSPRHFDALHMLGVVEAQRGNAAAAVELIARALAIQPTSALAHNNLAGALRVLRRKEALAEYDRAIELKRDYVEALADRGATLLDVDRAGEALASLERALALRATPAVLADRSVALERLGRHEDALASSERALSLAPDYLPALRARAMLLRRRGRPAEALADLERALLIAPQDAQSLVMSARTLLDLSRPDLALAVCERALRLAPAGAEALGVLGMARLELGKTEEALADFERALDVEPGNAELLNNCAHALQQLRRYDAAASAYARLLEVDPGHPYATGRLLLALMQCCDWTRFAELTATVVADVRADKRSITPFAYQALADSPRELLRCATIFAAETAPRAGTRAPGARGGGRIRIGYVSGEFRAQATSTLIVDLIERHDRTEFEVFGFDNGHDDGSALRRRVCAAFDEMVGIARLDDAQAAAQIGRRGIDVLVNLNGYFGRSRTGVFALRAAPVQVSYLGFPGTMGAAFMDYLVADGHVIPPRDEQCYAERIAWLPDCYLAHDSRRRVPEAAPERATLQLPDAGFVFCCFNNSYKITPPMFDVWMRLLGACPGSVLWLLEDNAAASRNLRREAAARGIASERLVFAPRLPYDQHLARHLAADLFLDTLPCNAHTTAGDALWVGLPLLTCEGTTFPGRVAASLLNAAGLPELITRNLDEYEARALSLAASPAMLAESRERLERNRSGCALFDTDRLRRHIEAAYRTMHERHLRGEPPQSFVVPPAG